jgi:thiol-disulfide isomerase/thioredoxin
MEEHKTIDWKKYVIVLLITASLFLTASYVSNYFGNKKIDQLKSIQDKISIDLLSSETQFTLLSELSCKNISDSVLSGELGELGSKLEWGEQNLGTGTELSYLKQYYSLLEIKDYLLMKKISERCGVKSAFILYFYTTAEHCSDCEKQGVVLSSLREKYPELRVYSFDFSNELSAVQAMLHIYKIQDTKLPALVINDDLMTGFHPLEELDTIIKNSFKLQESKPETTTKKAPTKSSE